MLLAANIAVE